MLEGARPRDHGAQGRAVRAQLPDRRDPQGRLDRHRGRRRHALLLLVQGPPRAARRARAARRRAGDAVEERHLHRPARLHLAAGRRGPHQRLQLPGLGDAREARADPARGRAGDREAGLGDRLPGRGGVPDHDRSGHPAARRGAADRRRRRRPVRPSDLAGRGQLHRLGRDRDEARGRTRSSRARASASSPSATASTPRCSAPTRRPARPSSTCSSRKSRPR